MAHLGFCVDILKKGAHTLLFKNNNKHNFYKKNNIYDKEKGRSGK